jgi:type VI protein secretion system component VasA
MMDNFLFIYIMRQSLTKKIQISTRSHFTRIAVAWPTNLTKPHPSLQSQISPLFHWAPLHAVSTSPSGLTSTLATLPHGVVAALEKIRRSSKQQAAEQNSKRVRKLDPCESHPIIWWKLVPAMNWMQGICTGTLTCAWAKSLYHVLQIGLHSNHYVRVLLRNGMCVYQCMYVNLYQSYHTTN